MRKNIHSVFAAPGHKVMIPTAEPLTSSACASVKERTKALRPHKRALVQTDQEFGNDGQMPRFVPIEELFKGWHFNRTSWSCVFVGI